MVKMWTVSESLTSVAVTQHGVVDRGGVAAGHPAHRQQHRLGLVLVTSEVNKRMATTAAVSSVVVGQQTTNLVALVHSYAIRRSVVTSV
jgi:hypothetical protein